MIGKLIFIAEFNELNEKLTLSNLKTISNSDPNQILIHLDVILYDNKIKEIYHIL